MIDLAMLAASAVTVLTSLLTKAIEKGSEKAGEQAVVGLFDSLKQRLVHQGAQNALQDLAKNPTDADSQASLRVQLRKAMESDPGLAADLQRWTGQAGRATQSQVATATDHSTVTQIQGSGNTIR